MNRKRILSVLLVLVALLTCACGTVEDEPKLPDSTTKPGSSTPAPTTTAPVNEEVTLSEAVIYDENGITVTVKGLSEGFMGTEVKLEVSSTSDKNLIVSTDVLSVNGYMMPLSSLYCQVAAGKKANSEITLMTSELEQSGITTISKIEFRLSIIDSDTFQTVATSDLITLTTSAADYVQSVDDSGEELYNAENIRVVCKGLKSDLIWDGTLVFFMDNGTAEDVYIYAENVSVNGYMVTATMWSTLRSGTKLIDGMLLLDLEEVELESVDDITNIEFNLRIVSTKTLQEIATTDVISLNFS